MGCTRGLTGGAVRLLSTSSPRAKVHRFRRFLSPSIVLCLAVIFFCLHPSAQSAQLTLAWDPSKEPVLAGYKVYFGTTPRTYENGIRVGKVTQYTLTGLFEGRTYFVAATAYDASDNESAYSNEVSGIAVEPLRAITVTTSPPGLQVWVDGVVYTAPQTFQWTVGSSHTLSAPSPQNGVPGTRYVHASWSDAGAPSHLMSVEASDTVYTAYFNTEYALEAAVQSPGTGLVTPSGTNWFKSGEGASVKATVNPGFRFSGWSGDFSGAANPASFNVDGPKKIVANFSQNQYTLTVNVDPAGSGSVSIVPSKPTYVYGERVTLAATANIGFGFAGWSEGATGTANPITVTVNGNMNVNGRFSVIPGSFSVTPSGEMMVSGNPGGPFSPLSRDYTLQNIGSTEMKWKVFKSKRWLSLSQASGTLLPGESAVVTVSLNNLSHGLASGSYTDTLSFINQTNGSGNKYCLVVLSVGASLPTTVVSTNPPRLRVTVDGATYLTPHAFNWEEGSVHTVSTFEIQNGTSSSRKRYAFDSWNDGQSQDRVITAAASNMTYVGNFKTQYLLTIGMNPAKGGVVMPAGQAWYDAGQTISITAQPNQGYRFSNWSGKIQNPDNPTTLEMKEPKNLVAHFRIAKEGTASQEIVTPQAMGGSKLLPLVGDLESPSEGKKVSGVKTIYGWALDPGGVQKIEFFIDDSYMCDIPYGGMREDVAEAHPDYPNADRSGFALIWNYSSLSAGNHLASVKIWNLRGEVLELAATVWVNKFHGESVTQASPNEWVMPDVKITADGEAGTYDVRIEWVNESQSFEISEIIPK